MPVIDHHAVQASKFLSALVPEYQRPVDCFFCGKTLGVPYVTWLCPGGQQEFLEIGLHPACAREFSMELLIDCDEIEQQKKDQA